ncbi:MULTISPECIES: NAD/NADP octopine/nopaline dehydrogenase family protein [Jonquetella]|uniref:Glycerol-3-phosphate dehydrogenase n=1 Tax=Jonquetella anthropi DSM 22815 TaxID=885272 RepID=H0ULX6_9BACT|nr:MULTISPECIES: NAD/NADP octopine/nopaline dehydrogenase family protein [Jonquetella]EEX49261.1 NAD/NADP octopine/nopaline dehydrogenase, alpha-helical domain protein [Jonquetella anthropi E3_33 E1]EHM12518.1 glycerol-3-phosphate dehydrogenase [Jonquetella anthropi DSM 22815]ERL24851.1 NAD/NADP octopine/nopaline dehydrogenase, alpha-helical domain protein [Jonquetella sp. BV3C21]
MSNVVVVGAGAGGRAVAADLSLQGHRVTLLQAPSHSGSLDDLRGGKILLESLPSCGRPGGQAQLHLVTVDPSEALKGPAAVFVVVPSYAQSDVADFLAPHLREFHQVCLMPGNLLGAVAFVRQLRAGGNDAVTHVAETDSMIFTASRTAGGVSVRGFKDGMGVAAFPAEGGEELLKSLRAIYPALTVSPTVLETGLSNPNVLIHVPLTVLNWANAERGLDMLSYYGAFTPGIGRVIEALDGERMALASRGVAIRPVVSLLGDWYRKQGASGSSIFQLISTNPLYKNSKLPKSTNHRYIIEDVPFGLVPAADLLNRFGLPNAVHLSLITLASLASGTDFQAAGRSLRGMGYNWSGEEILDRVRRRGL